MCMVEQTSDILSRYPKGHRDCLIPILQDIQEEFGFIPESSIVEVSRYLNLPSGKIFGLASFYNQFRFEPRGRYHIQFCHGTSCHVNRAADIIGELQKRLLIQPGQTTRDGMFSLEYVACMGACHQAPLIRVNENYHTRLKPGEIPDIIDSYINLEE